MSSSRIHFLLFCCSGVMALLLDWGSLTALVHLAHVPHLIARLISFIIAATFTWQFNSRITFQERKERYSGVMGWLSYMGGASLGGIANYLAYSLVMYFLGVPTTINLLVGVSAGSLAGLVLNYSICNNWLFIQADKREPEEPCK